MLKKYKTRKLAKQIYLALLANPERYRYMTECYKSGKYSHEELNEKNANKAYRLAESFLNFKGASKRSSNVVENEQSKKDFCSYRYRCNFKNYETIECMCKDKCPWKKSL